MTKSIEFRAKLACLYAGAVWGLFWIPLRALEDAGLHELWITAVYFLIPTVCLLPINLWRWQKVMSGGIQLQITAMLSGGALLLYSTSIVYTEVVRAMLLFYLTPVWATILARFFLNDAITPTRVASMVLAVTGMLTIFGLGAQFPVPQNIGDWLGLGSGFLWAIAMVRIRMIRSHSAIELTVGFFQWSLIFSAVAAFLIAPEHIPSIEKVLPALPLLIIFMALLVLPGTYASLWGPKFLSPGIVGLLFMTEIVVGAISVALLAGEPFGVREITGVILIAGASLLEPFLSLHFSRTKHY
ncbi:DMT family transporter [Pseudopelagicola sp. nBUS_20]|uniref:DMT family transporter n=1 Tax=Pseudopelagicola sp. nBUS_20 TaxID=3395317 RepID=UPI003EBB0A4C